MQVALMIPCYIDLFYPQVGVATLELLEKLNVDVMYPFDQTCCGQPMANSGCFEEARALIALWKYRVQLPGFELPKPVDMAQQEFDHHLATTLDGMADRMEGKSSEGSDNFRRSIKSLDQTIRTYDSGKSHEAAAQFGAFLSLSRRIESLTLSLDEDMQ